MRIAALVIVAACGPGLAAQNKPHEVPSIPERTVRPGVPPPSDVAGIRRLLVREVTNGGLRFPDAACRTQFGAAGPIAPAMFDAFAKCLGMLHLRATGRTSSFDDTSVLADDAGFEIEARVTDGALEYIGFSARAPGVPDLPTITPATLESLRTGGDPNATLSAFDAKTVLYPREADAYTEYLRICLDDAGGIAIVEPATSTRPAPARLFAALVRSWTFRPFVVDGAPLSACAIVAMHYPASSGTTDRLPWPPEFSKAGNRVYTADPRDLDTFRVSGTKTIIPDDIDKIRLNGAKLFAIFKLCVDEMGSYASGRLLLSSGVPRYDAKIAREMKTNWRYKPYLVDGVPVPVCSHFKFVYSQK